MSVSTLTSILFDHGAPPRTSQLRDIPERPPTTMFKGFKDRLSRKGSNPLSRRDSAERTVPKSSASRASFLAPQSNSSNPFTSTPPATRRPNRSGMNAFSTPSNEPPPAYTPGPANPGSSSLAVPNTAATADDPYSFLKSFDTIFLIDDSGSMAGRSWRETAEALKTIAPICTQRDADGIDIYFLNHPDSSIYKNVTSSSTVQEIFQTVRPGGGTPTGQRLDRLLRPYIRRFKANPDTTRPINIIVITDGEPSDDVEAPIIYAAQRLEEYDAPAWQVGIQFFQVGNEPGARQHLKQLDDGLKEASGDRSLRDIVDTVPFTGEGGGELTATGVMKVVLGSVNRRLDRNSVELHRR